MSDSSDTTGKLGDTGVVELTGKIMVVAIMLLFFVVVFVFCLHLYAKWFWHRHQESTINTTSRRRRRRLDFAAGHLEITLVSAVRQGLESSVLKTIPIILFNPNDFQDGLECAVCLCEVSEGEKCRLLPKCNHGFHVDCIDMWFQSHSTCPLCRNTVANQKPSNSATETSLEDILQAPMGENSGDNSFPIEAASFPTNVLFWGDETQVSTFGPCLEEDHHQNSAMAEPSSSSSPTSNLYNGTLVIDIPRQNNEEDQEQKSPMPTRLRSLKRLLSGNRRVINPSSTPMNLDFERGQIS